MEIILFWFLVSIAIGVWASNKGRSGFGWFVLAVIISPILAAIFLAVSKDLSKPALSPATATNDTPTTSTHVTCPDCAEYVRKQARVCKHCGCKLTPVVEVAAATVGGGGLTGRQIVGIVLALVLVFIMFAGNR
jgi:hypothetical protein